jgi:molybdate transport system substrate-binding protein
MKLISSVGMKAIIQELAPIYKAENRAPIDISYGSTAMILDRIKAGEAADLVILASPAINGLLEQGVLLPGACMSLASTGVGMSCRANTPHPNISTVESLRDTLVQASSIAYTTTGVSGLYFAQVLEKMGLLDEVGAKAVTLPGGQIASLLTDGSADLAVQLTSELVGFPGTEYIGPLPPELQMEMMFGAGIFLSSSNSESAVDFLEFLSQPQWTTIYSKNGMNQALN